MFQVCLINMVDQPRADVLGLRGLGLGADHGLRISQIVPLLFGRADEVGHAKRHQTKPLFSARPKLQADHVSNERPPAEEQADEQVGPLLTFTEIRFA
jgi:hypothetical protein